MSGPLLTSCILQSPSKLPNSPKRQLHKAAHVQEHPSWSPQTKANMPRTTVSDFSSVHAPRYSKYIQLALHVQLLRHCQFVLKPVRLGHMYCRGSFDETSPTDKQTGFTFGAKRNPDHTEAIDQVSKQLSLQLRSSIPTSSLHRHIKCYSNTSCTYCVMII